jgi:hypothetical protein
LLPHFNLFINSCCKEKSPVRMKTQIVYVADFVAFLMNAKIQKINKNIILKNFTNLILHFSGTISPKLCRRSWTKAESAVGTSAMSFSSAARTSKLSWMLKTEQKLYLYYLIKKSRKLIMSKLILTLLHLTQDLVLMLRRDRFEVFVSLTLKYI